MKSMMEEFKTYKEKQNYYREKYKNRGKVFFAQDNTTAQLFSDDKVGTIKKKKGRTYIKGK